MDKHLGHIIRTVRKERRSSQAELAARTNITRSRISRIESGSVQPNVAEISAIAICLEDLDIIRAYWTHSQLHGAAAHICARMGFQVTTDLELTARQFASDIITRALRIMETFKDLPHNDHGKHENILLASQEAVQISNLATALRLLICDIKGG